MRSVAIVIVASCSLFSGAASSQQALTKDDLICSLDPSCQRPRLRQLPFDRGVKITGPIQPAEPGSVNLYVNFAFDSSELETDSTLALDQLGTALSSPVLAASRFVVAGHTDAKGTDDYNQKLSERRADVVCTYLIRKFHVAPERLVARGYGRSQLLDSIHPDDGVNRRVQISNDGLSAKP
jgi:outer membrane protein OmpA-like peptidoglycan-associated protein